MAKVYRTTSASHPYCYALQQSEDVLISGAVLDLQTAVAPTPRHASLLADLAMHWLAGNGLCDRTLIMLNNLRRADGLGSVQFVDGHSSTYSLERGEEKATHRKNILEKLRELKLNHTAQYLDVLARARSVAKSLPTRDPLQFVA